MIMPYACDSGDGNPPIVVIQMLTGDADSLAWCADCWPVFVDSAHAALFDTPPAAAAHPGAGGPDSDDDGDQDDGVDAPVPYLPAQVPPPGQGEPPTHPPVPDESGDGSGSDDDGDPVESSPTDVAALPA